MKQAWALRSDEIAVWSDSDLIWSDQIDTDGLFSLLYIFASDDVAFYTFVAVPCRMHHIGSHIFFLFSLIRRLQMVCNAQKVKENIIFSFTKRKKLKF